MKDLYYQKKERYVSILYNSLTRQGRWYRHEIFIHMVGQLSKRGSGQEARVSHFLY